MKAVFPSIAASMLILAVTAGPALAQENVGGNITQDRGGAATAGQDQAGRKAQTAQVGAGTTNGTTTGSSGPKDASKGMPGQNELPPLPSPQQCDAFKDTPAYQACLWVVLRD